MQIGINDDNQEACEAPGCSKIDPLAARCTNCRKALCARHISGSAHSCAAVRNALVAQCPVCSRVVPLEYHGQALDEAVSQHMSRGCRDVAAQASNGNNANSTNTNAKGSNRLGGTTTAATALCPMCNSHVPKQFPSQSADEAVSRHIDRGDCGRALKAAIPPQQPPIAGPSYCGIVGCNNAHSKEKQVICDRCGRGFCIEHRTPAKHGCEGQPKHKVVTSTEAGRGGNSSPPPQSSSSSTTFAALLSGISNTAGAAVGKATERPEDMRTPLVCFVVPATGVEQQHKGEAAAAEAPLRLAPVAPFFMNVPMNIVLGKALDMAVNEASRLSAAVRPSPASPWHMHAVGLPVPDGAVASPGVYPPMPLSTLVRESPLATTARSGAAMVLVVSPYRELPAEVLAVLSDRGRSLGKEKKKKGRCDSDNCQVM